MRSGHRPGQNCASPPRRRRRSAVQRPSVTTVSRQPALSLSLSLSLDLSLRHPTEDRTFRTNVVLLFLGSNMLVILLFTSSAFTEWLRSNWSSASAATFNPYLTAIFYSVLFLSAVRFIGCVLYLVFRLFGF